MRKIPSPTAMVTSLVLLSAVSCVPPKQEVRETTRPSTVNVTPPIPPSIVRVVNGDRSLDVAWTRTRDRIISGYNIYIVTTPIATTTLDSAALDTLKSFNFAPYPGDTKGDEKVVSFSADHLDNGVRYYVFVRTIYPDRSMSGPSNIAMAVCGPRGTFQLFPRFESDHDGYSLVQNHSVRADASDNDLYFYAKDGHDYLASPARLDGFLRKSKMTLFAHDSSKADLRDYLRRLQLDVQGDKVEVSKGSWVLLRTPERYSAVLQMVDVVGVGKERHLSLQFALCPIPDELIF